MVEITEINNALEKAADFLAKHQISDGSWKREVLKHNQPPEYHKELVVSAHNAISLIMCGKTEYLENIKKAIHFTYESELNEMDPLPWWAHKLWVLKYAVGNIYAPEIKKIASFLSEKQKDGFWPAYPLTSNLINFFCILSLNGVATPEIFEKSKKWFKKTMIDEKGWSRDNDSDAVFETFTSLAILASIICGESPTAPHIQNARRFLEKTQEKNGMWRSSKYTSLKPTVYSTALATLALMLISDDPFNKHVEKGIKSLLKTQSGGAWPYLQKGKFMYYTTFFAIQTLSFYRYLKEKLKTQRTELLKNKLNLQEISACYFLEFEESLKEMIKNKTYENVLSSKLLGTTNAAVERRKDMLNVLFEKKELDVAAIIDELKKNAKYSYLNKKHHITQIKSDMEYLNGLNLVSKRGSRYFVVFKLI